ncbi:DUF4190 domain-containing protein [Amycolatopsis sp. OK19-0408]|uniref:DUF4190 domain-containing protein n=1 Tax=Amycolatopsis iheyensis TaxID=2945988 RepID=A0A9X2N9W1_9PSEU|nr:DUF4190 domain-containing protein [Amycolatopsis iheyensis]MCR6483673.1 DUF4190 domain-containing protein [Amycolatopsis iheyensis]
MSYAPMPPSSAMPVSQYKNGLGTAGFVLGLVGLIFAFIPIIGVVAWPLTILGLIFGIIGTLRAGRGQANNKGMAITGTVLSAIGLVICFIWTVALGAAVSDTANGLPTPAAPAAVADAGAAPANAAPTAAAGRHTVLLEVTTAAKSNVQWSSGFTANSQAVLDKGKTWSQSLTMDDLAFTTVTVTPVDYKLGSKANTCKITVDGKTVAENANGVAALCTFQP